MKIKLYILTFVLAYTGISYGQQDPQFTQYMYNMSVINPAYTNGDPGDLQLGLLYRSQWVGVTGAPKTGTFFGHMPLNNNVEVGISFVNDDIGDIITENKIYGDFAYKLPLKNNSALSFGLKAGVTLFDANITNLDLIDQNDINFAENINKTFFNIGAGAYYNTERFYVGLSMPNLLQNPYLENNSGSVQGVEKVHAFLTGGYVFDLNENFKFKPAFMTKLATGEDVSLDLTANFLYKEKVEFGIGYRTEDSISGLVNFRINDQFRIGYAYDYITSNIGDYASGSHEVFLLFNMAKPKRGFDKSPRFF